MDVSPSLFWSKVNKGNGCWKWTACLTSMGYGVMRRLGRNYFAHRIAWTFLRGEIPQGMMVLHHCDNPKCVNPDHLWLGTQSDNLKDMAKKGRATSKLTDAQVLAIRKMSGSGRKIAPMFGISQVHVARLKRGVGWSHL